MPDQVRALSSADANVVQPPSGGEPNLAKDNETVIRKDLCVTGNISGQGTLLIEGGMDGVINLPESRVTIGRNGQLNAEIAAGEIVILGTVVGDLKASNRVEIRNGGSLTGDVVASRIYVEEGAYFSGSIDIRKPDENDVAETSSPGAA